MYVIRIRPNKVRSFSKREFNEYVMKMKPSQLRTLKDNIIAYSA